MRDEDGEESQLPDDHSNCFNVTIQTTRYGRTRDNIVGGLEAEAISTRGAPLVETIEVLVPGIGNACASLFLKSI